MLKYLVPLTFIALAAAHGLVVLAPLDAVQGWPQKIFYFHVSSAWSAYWMLAIGLYASVRVLLAGDDQAERVAEFSALGTSAVEVALVLFTVLNVTGPIWGKPIWGTWWQWDPRLTTNFVLWMTLATATMLRSLLPFNVRNARVLAVLAIFAAANVPVVHYSVRWWRSLHPQPVVMQEKIGGGLDSEMVAPLVVMLLGMTLLAHVLLHIAQDLENRRLQ